MSERDYKEAYDNLMSIVRLFHDYTVEESKQKTVDRPYWLMTPENEVHNAYFKGRKEAAETLLNVLIESGLVKKGDTQ